MANLAFVYGSTYGHTERVVNHTTATLTQCGHHVLPWRGDRITPTFSLRSYDGCLVAASVLFGKHQRYIRDFVRRYADELNAVPSAFISVSGAGASARPDDRRAAQAYVDHFLEDVGWHPVLARWFPGEVAYRRYNPVLRYVMKRISRTSGRPTDTSRDYDFTDWGAVEAFAREFSALLPGT